MRAGRLAGIPYQEIYHWTWGEVEDFVNLELENRRITDRRLARIAMQSVSLMARSISGNQKEYIFSEEFDWLFTPEEHREAKKQRLMNAIHVKEAP